MSTLVAGPSALGGDRSRFLALTWTLAVTNFKLKFFGSALGYVWQLMRPLLLFGVLYVVFTQFVDLGGGIRLYPVALLAGLVLFTFFSEATGSAVTSLIDREALLRKIQFPRLVVPLSVTLEALFNLALNSVVILIFLLASGGTPRTSWLELLLLLPLLMVLATGAGTLLSALYVRYRDVRPIWDVVLQMLFYGSAVFFPIQTIHEESVRRLVLLNPIAALIQELRHALIGPGHPSAAAAIGGWEYLLVPAGIGLAIAIGGYVYFDRRAARIAEDL